MALEQSYLSRNASEATLKDMGKWPIALPQRGTPNRESGA